MTLQTALADIALWAFVVVYGWGALMAFHWMWSVERRRRWVGAFAAGLVHAGSMFVVLAVSHYREICRARWSEGLGVVASAWPPGPLANPNEVWWLIAGLVQLPVVIWLGMRLGQGYRRESR